MFCRPSAPRLGLGQDRGTVTAELAIAIPSVLMLLGMVMGTARVGVDSVTASAMAHDAARALVAGMPTQAAEANARRAGASLTVDPTGCVVVRFPPAWGMPAELAVVARACTG